MKCMQLMIFAVSCSCLFASPQRQRNNAAVIKPGQLVQDLSKAQMDAILKDPEAINTLIGCIESINTCTSPAAKRITEQTFGAVNPNSCKGCSPATIQKRNLGIKYFIGRLSKDYPAQFNKIAPQLKPVLARI